MQRRRLLAALSGDASISLAGCAGAFPSRSTTRTLPGRLAGNLATVDAATVNRATVDAATVDVATVLGAITRQARHVWPPTPQSLAPSLARLKPPVTGGLSAEPCV
jgi:hypothetical protein